MAIETDSLEAELVLAEDDPDDRFLIVRALKRVRPALRVMQVCDGTELIEYLRARASGVLPQLVLLDLNMPRMDGREVLALLHADARLRTIPVVVLSTSVEREDLERARALGAADFISKPDEFSKTVGVLSALLAQRLPLEPCFTEPSGVG